MSKEFYENILKEIDRREKEKAEYGRWEEEKRKSKEKRKEELKIKKIKRIIFDSFDSHLKELLKELRDYNGHHMINKSELPYNDFLIRRSVYELGFSIDIWHSTNEEYYLQIILGNANTPAQKHLLNFRNRLRLNQDVKERKVLCECYIIRKFIEEGKFEYAILGEANALKSAVITVNGLEQIDTEFEREIVRKYFDKYGLKFIDPKIYGVTSNHSDCWNFMIKYMQ